MGMNGEAYEDDGDLGSHCERLMVWNDEDESR